MKRYLSVCLSALVLTSSMAYALHCDGPEDCASGDCSGHNVGVDVTTLPNGDVSVGLHNCDPSTQTCSYAVGTFDPDNDNRWSAENGDCKAVVQANQGLDWGDVEDCDDLTWACH